MFPWGDAPDPFQRPAWTEGETVYSGASRGTVVSVDETTMGIVWDDGDGGVIVYPVDADYLRKKMPWE